MQYLCNIPVRHWNFSCCCGWLAVESEIK